MDVLTHALAGFAIGLKTGQPLTGIAFAIMPDLALGIRRKNEPNTAYRITHSIWFVLSFVWWKTAFLAVLSHIFIDIFTHGSKWNPRLFFPFDFHFSCFKEWEFGNTTYFLGLITTVLLIIMLIQV